MTYGLYYVSLVKGFYLGSPQLHMQSPALRKRPEISYETSSHIFYQFKFSIYLAERWGGADREGDRHSFVRSADPKAAPVHSGSQLYHFIFETFDLL